jgi:hypothetical protein
LQARVEKRLAKSLSFLASYTWSKTLDDNAGFEGSRLISPYKEKALSSQHRAHLLTTALNYLLPVGKGQPALNNLHPVLEGMLGGWQVSGILTVSSGSPFSPGFSGDRANCACTNRPDRIGNGNLPSSERSITRWFDASAFVTSAQFVHGNAGRNILIGPGLQNVDFGLFKNFQIRERNSLQFRWESFNAFNHANFGQPSATVNIPATAGRIFGAAPGRQMQFGLKWLF